MSVGLNIHGVKSPVTNVIDFDQVDLSFIRRDGLRTITKDVLRGINLSIPSGESVCLLGPSGCGKTTLVNLIMGNLVPSKGSVHVMGEVAPYKTARSHIGYMPQDEALYEDITAEENLRFFASLYGITRINMNHKIDELLDFTQLTNEKYTLVKNFSGGMKRRLSLAVALLSSPSLLVLDEPTVGLDPSHRLRIWSLFEHLQSDGTTLLITTHVMDEAQHCSKLALLHKGSLIAFDTPSKLMEATHSTTIEEVFLAFEQNN